MSSYYDDASLMLLASGGAQKDGKVYSVKPTDGSGDFTFTRGSNLSATRVDASQLIEKGRENLVKQSNSFGTAPWTASNASVTSGQSGYDGSNDAWKIEANTTAQTYVNQVLLSSISANTTTTFSVYAKSGNVDFLKILLVTAGSNSIITFDLTDGSNSSNLRTISVNAENVGNGWYRCSITAAPGTNTNAVRIEARSTAPDNTAVAGSFIYIQDSQVELGLAATSVIETGASTAQAGILENTPRFDYSGGATCPSLLLEPSRTNLLPQSEYYLSGGWVINSGTLTTNYAVSPEGLQNASKINFTSGGEIVRTTSFTAGQAYTFSFYAKVESGTFDFTYGNINYTLTSGTATTEWQRFEITQTAPVASRYPKIDATNTGDLLIWGFQIEQGSYPTSYIPTYGVSQTRALDSGSTATPSTSLFGQTEGTLYCEYIAVSDNTTNASRFARLRNSSGSNQVYLQHFANNSILAVVYNGSNQFIGASSSGFVTAGETYKCAVAYKNGDYAFYINGQQIGLSSSTGLGTLSLDRFDLDGSGNISKSVKNAQSLVFKTRLSNLDLAILTGATTYNTFAAMALALNYTVYE